MSHMESAKAAISAELKSAEQGLAYYQRQVAALQATLKSLDDIAAGTPNALAQPAGAKRGRKPGKTADAAPDTAIPKKRGRKPGTKVATSPKTATSPKAVAKAKKTPKKRGTDGLPFTGGSFWSDLVTATPKSFADILNDCVAGLDFIPNPAQKKKLSQRMTFALNALVKDKKIKDSGSGRERRFFK